MFCPWCGEQHPDTYMHCPKTGQPLREGALQPVLTIGGGRGRSATMVTETRLPENAARATVRDSFALHTPPRATSQAVSMVVEQQ